MLRTAWCSTSGTGSPEQPDLIQRGPASAEVRGDAVGKVDVEKLKARFLKARAAWRVAQKREREKRKKKEQARLRRIGGIVLAMVREGAYPRDEFMADMDSFLSDPGDRTLFGLPPREAAAVVVVERVRKRGGYMTRKQLIDRVVESSEVKLSKKDAGQVLDALFGSMGRAVCDNGRFAWPGFGIFTVKKRAARQGRNPRTGEVMEVKASRTVSFKPAPALKGKL